MANIETLISGHNKQLLQSSIEKTNIDQRKCNCRSGIKNCPLKGNCQMKSVIYKAEVNSNKKKTTYIGQSANAFKERFSNHIMSFSNQKYETSTHLSKHVWNLKRQKIPFDISWSIVTKASTYHPARRKYNLCLMMIC